LGKFQQNYGFMTQILQTEIENFPANISDLAQNCYSGMPCATVPPKIAKFCWHKTFQVGHEPSVRTASPIVNAKLTERKSRSAFCQIRHLIHSRWPVRDVPPKKGKKICIRFPGKKNMLQRPL
jgi:hypothetical protein